MIELAAAQAVQTRTIFLADTNIISELARKSPDRKSPDADVLKWLSGVRYLAISAVTIEEAYFGFAVRADERKLVIFEAALKRAHSVYPIHAAIAKRAGILRGQLQTLGIVRSMQDMLIAATALAHQLIMATRNQRDFLGCGVQLINPFLRAEC